MSAPIPQARPGTRRGFPVLLLLFVGSGCAALIYEIVWLQLLQLVIGSSAVSLGVLLGTFMGGMCLGSLALPRLIAVHRHPLRVYALLELGIGLLGLAVLLGIPLVGRIYTAQAAPGLAGVLMRAVVCVLCLVPPTMLMGATLPVMARWAERSPQALSWLGLLYAGNIAGAVAGCLLAGFYLLRVHDMATASYVAVAINGILALASLGLAAQTARLPTPGFGPSGVPPPSQSEPRGANPETEPSPNAPKAGEPEANQGPHPYALSPRAVWVVIALSGMVALAAEVIWTRLLSLLLGGTVYTFAIILAVFLMGLGLGSGVVSLLLRGRLRPGPALGWCQFLAAAGIAWTAWMLAASLPYWPINPALTRNVWVTFQLDLVRCLWAVLPATILWGASFPLAMAAVAAQPGDPARSVGRVYAANTLGAIIGALGASMVLIVWLGTQNAQRVLIGLSALAGVWAFASPRLRSQGGDDFDTPCETRCPGALRAVWLLIPVGIAALLAWSVPKIPGALVAYGRYLPTRSTEGKVLYVGEGMNASVAVTELWDSGVRNFHVSGKIEASGEPQDMRLQLMLGHLPALVHPKPRSVLIVGFGAGVTAGSFVVHPDVERIVICEIEPLIPRVVAQYFAHENHNVLKDPRVEVVYDDARHYVLTTKEQFDIITSDPIHPWVKGAATLYTREYFELVKRHLKPGGLVTQWVPLYESSPDVVRSEFATFFAAFPDGTIWSNDLEGQGYDLVLLGQSGATHIDVDELQARLDSTNYLAVTLSLDGAGFKSAVDLLSTYAGRGPDLAPWLKNAQLNRDRNLRLQYLAGLGLNSDKSWGIYGEIVKYRDYPGSLFVATGPREKALRKAFGKTKSEH